MTKSNYGGKREGAGAPLGNKNGAKKKNKTSLQKVGRLLGVSKQAVSDFVKSKEIETKIFLDIFEYIYFRIEKKN